MWSTQSSAKDEIKRRTNIPEIEIGRAVKAMPTKRFGSRDMVHRLDIEKFIAETNQPPVAVRSKGNIRPFSPRSIAKIRTMGVETTRRRKAS